MCKNDLKLDRLPHVLQEIVLEFAFNLSKEQVLKSLDTILDILDTEYRFSYFVKKSVVGSSYFLAEPYF